MRSSAAILQAISVRRSSHDKVQPKQQPVHIGWYSGPNDKLFHVHSIARLVPTGEQFVVYLPHIGEAQPETLIEPLQAFVERIKSEGYEFAGKIPLSLRVRPSMCKKRARSR